MARARGLRRGERGRVARGGDAAVRTDVGPHAGARVDGDDDAPREDEAQRRGAVARLHVVHHVALERVQLRRESRRLVQASQRRARAPPTTTTKLRGSGAVHARLVHGAAGGVGRTGPGCARPRRRAARTPPAARRSRPQHRRTCAHTRAPTPQQGVCRSRSGLQRLGVTSCGVDARRGAHPASAARRSAARGGASRHASSKRIIVAVRALDTTRLPASSCCCWTALDAAALRFRPPRACASAPARLEVRADWFAADAMDPSQVARARPPRAACWGPSRRHHDEEGAQSRWRQGGGRRRDAQARWAQAQPGPEQP